MTNDETTIREIIERWSKAVRDHDLAAIRRDHTDDIMMFDVPPPFQSRGIDAYMASWDLFFAHATPRIEFDFTEIEVTAGSDVAFATAIGRCLTDGEPLDFRLTMGLRKRDGRWIITHEHHSIPAET